MDKNPNKAAEVAYEPCGHTFAIAPGFSAPAKCPTCAANMAFDLRADFANAAANKYEGGGIRSSDFDKPDWEAMLSPIAMEFYADYMFYCSFLPNGQRRDEDNWQNGVPLSRWIKSLFRHVFHLHRNHRSKSPAHALDTGFAVCGILFNAFGYLDAYLKAHPEAFDAMKQELRNKLQQTQIAAK